MPWSIASLASGAGASAAAVATTSETNIASTRQRYGASSSARPRSLRPRPLVCVQAAAELGRMRLTVPPPRARLAGQEHLVGHALLDDLAVQVRALEQLVVGPVAATRPSSSTTISSASAIVDSRCAITNVVRPAITSRQRELDLLLGRGVDRRGRVVEDQDPRVGEDRARDRDPLALAARQRQPALADHRVVALGQRLDERRRPARPPPRARPPRARRLGRARMRCCRGRWPRTGTGRR